MIEVSLETWQSEPMLGVNCSLSPVTRKAHLPIVVGVVSGVYAPFRFCSQPVSSMVLLFSYWDRKGSQCLTSVAARCKFFTHGISSLYLMTVTFDLITFDCITQLSIESPSIKTKRLHLLFSGCIKLFKSTTEKCMMSLSIIIYCLL